MTAKRFARSYLAGTLLLALFLTAAAAAAAPLDPAENARGGKHHLTIEPGGVSVD